jgi:hypothetical protein
MLPSARRRGDINFLPLFSMEQGDNFYREIFRDITLQHCVHTRTPLPSVPKGNSLQPRCTTRAGLFLAKLERGAAGHVKTGDKREEAH